MEFIISQVPVTAFRLETKKEYAHANRFIKYIKDKVMKPYLELQKYADNPFTISDRCISCGLCGKVCPC